MLKRIKKQFTIEQLGFTLEREFDKNFVHCGESHNFIEMVFLDNGEMEVVENEKIYILRAGEIIFHAPMEFHKLCSLGQVKSKVYNLSCIINGTVPKKLFDGIFRLDINEKNEFLNIFKKAHIFLHQDEKGSSYIGQVASSLLEAFIIKLCNNRNPDDTLISDSSALHFKKLVVTMNEYLYENLSLSELARMNNISVSYLKLLFCRYADVSPKKYYKRLQLVEAVRMLEEGVSITEISRKLKFSSTNYFSMFFKKNIGISPSMYLKNNTNNIIITQ